MDVKLKNKIMTWVYVMIGYSLIMCFAYFIFNDILSTSLTIAMVSLIPNLIFSLIILNYLNISTTLNDSNDLYSISENNKFYVSRKLKKRLIINCLLLIWASTLIVGIMFLMIYFKKPVISKYYPIPSGVLLGLVVSGAIIGYIRKAPKFNNITSNNEV